MQYFRDPEATRKAFHGGYFHTGDLAIMHPDGTVAVIDRSKDIIISGGEVSQLISMPRYSRLLASGQNASSLAIEQG